MGLISQGTLSHGDAQFSVLGGEPHSDPAGVEVGLSVERGGSRSLVFTVAMPAPVLHGPVVHFPEKSVAGEEEIGRGKGRTPLLV